MVCAGLLRSLLCGFDVCNLNYVVELAMILTDRENSYGWPEGAYGVLVFELTVID